MHGNGNGMMRSGHGPDLAVARRCGWPTPVRARPTGASRGRQAPAHVRPCVRHARRKVGATTGTTRSLGRRAAHVTSGPRPITPIGAGSNERGPCSPTPNAGEEVADGFGFVHAPGSKQARWSLTLCSGAVARCMIRSNCSIFYFRWKIIKYQLRMNFDFKSSTFTRRFIANAHAPFFKKDFTSAFKKAM